MLQDLPAYSKPKCTCLPASAAVPSFSPSFFLSFFLFSLVSLYISAFYISRMAVPSVAKRRHHLAGEWRGERSVYLGRLMIDWIP